jgi:lysophospholipase L1-like esterase
MPPGIFLSIIYHKNGLFERGPFNQNDQDQEGRELRFSPLKDGSEGGIPRAGLFPYAFFAGAYFVAAAFLFAGAGTFIPFRGSIDLFRHMFFAMYPGEAHCVFLFRTMLVLLGVLLLADMAWVRHMQGRKRAIANLAMVLLFFGLTEGLSRLYLGSNPRILRPDPALNWRMQPGFKGYEFYAGVSINSMGFRCPEFTRRKKPGEIRIVVAGDSSAFGAGVEEGSRFSDLLEKNLKILYPGTDFRVINCAVPGYTTFQVRQLVKDEVSRWSPDVLILSINNDATTFELADSDNVPPALLMPLFRVLYASDIYLMLRKVMMSKGNADVESDSRPLAGYVRKKDVLRVSLEEASENYRDMIARMKKVGAKTIIISMPLMFPVRMEYEADPVVGHRKLMERVCSQTGSLFVNVYEPWSQERHSSNLFLDKMHPNSAGHERIADELMWEMVEKGILPGPKN